MEKYKLTDYSIEFEGRKLFRIVALRDFGDIKCGDLGGFVERYDNFSQYGDAWICGNAKVCDNARVCDDAMVYGDAKVCDNAMVYNNARVYGNARICDNAKICGDAEVYGNTMVYNNARVCGYVLVSDDVKVYSDAEVYGDAKLCGDAIVCCNADYIVFKNWWSSGRYFTWTRSNNMWNVGCFFGTGAELVKKAYTDSEKSGIEYERIVNYVENIIAK